MPKKPEDMTHEELVQRLGPLEQEDAANRFVAAIAKALNALPPQHDTKPLSLRLMDSYECRLHTTRSMDGCGTRLLRYNHF